MSDSLDVEPIAFEAAFARLEEILQRLNAGNVCLDESLNLFKEADQLIILCHTRLTDAETQVETLIKNRAGDLAIGADNRPQTAPFSPHAKLAEYE